MKKLFRVSPLNEPVNEDSGADVLYELEIRDLARAFCGALFLAVPLHFTIEMWARARVMPNWDLVIVILVTYLANVGFNFFSGYKDQAARQAPWFDAIESMGIGFIASAITLALIDQVSYEMPFEIVMKCIALQMVPTSFGASLAKSQLGSSSSENDSELTDGWSADKSKIMGATLGALMFSFNIAATQEPIIISTSIQPFQLIGLVLFSLFVSWIMIFTAGFVQRDYAGGGIMGPKWAETLICYAISLAVSAVLLWMFGYLTTGTSLAMALPWIVVLGYVTSLGSSAGRLVI